MLIRTLTSDTPDCTFSFEWDVTYRGEPLDTRGCSAVDFVNARSQQTLFCQQDHDNPMGLVVDGVRTPLRELVHVDRETSVLLEATTLDLVEMLQLLRAAKQRGLQRVDLLYAEPGSYQREAVPFDAPWRREFTLSDNLRFAGVAGFACNLIDGSPKTLVAFLGYEGARLAQAIEQLSDMAAWSKVGVFGIPGYAPGWEMNALANNVAMLSTMKHLAVQYCAASSVTGALDILEEVHSRRRDPGTTVVAPLGTKPHTIATALFLVKHCEFQQATLVWDHPRRTRNRSEHVRRWHLYRVQLA